SAHRRPTRLRATICCAPQWQRTCSGSKRCAARRRTTGSTSSTSGMRTRPDRRAACTAVAAGALAWLGVVARAAATGTPAAAAAPFGFEQLMATLAQRRSGEARFTEERFVSGLEQTLHSSGTLSFTAPDRLARHTLTPRPESFVVEGNQLTLQRGERVRR